MREEISIGDIAIGDRIRKDMGSIRTLADSMERVGQLQPIGLDKNDNLLFGHRRILAAMLLNWEKVWFERFGTINEAAKRLQAERDENTEHKPFTPSEAAEMGMRLEAIEKPKAQDRKAATQSKPGEKVGSQGASNLDEPLKGRTDEKVAAAVGMSKDTYRKAKAVVEAAKNPDAPPEVKAAAEEMDRTGKVDPAFKKIKAAYKPMIPREAKVDAPSFDLSGAKHKAESGIRNVFRAWPEWARQDIPTFLRQLAKGDW